MPGSRGTARHDDGPRPTGVAGVTKATAAYPEALLALAGEVRADAVEPVAAVGLWDAPPGGRVAVELVREDDNPVDRNAVMVTVPVLEDLGHDTHVGWIPASKAAGVDGFAARMDAGVVPVAWVRSIPVGSPKDMKPGLVIYVAWP